MGFVPIPADDDFRNDHIQLDLSVRQPTDVVLTAPSTLSLFDQQPATLQATIAGFGVTASTDLEVDVDLPAGFTVSSAALGSAVCNVLLPNQARCFRSILSPGDSAQLTIRYQADAAGVYTGSIAVTPPRRHRHLQQHTHDHVPGGTWRQRFLAGAAISGTHRGHCE